MMGNLFVLSTLQLTSEISNLHFKCCLWFYLLLQFVFLLFLYLKGRYLFETLVLPRQLIVSKIYLQYALKCFRCTNFYL